MESPLRVQSAKASPALAFARSPRVVDLLLALGLFAGALAIRLPYLMQAPGFTDETEEILRSLEVSRGLLLPLVNTEAYMGALFNYLLGAVFFLFGPSFTIARLTVTLLGALTVPVVYFLGKTMEDRRTGVATSLLMLTSLTHVTNGHIAWGSCTAPFFASTTYALFFLALKRASGPLLLVSAFLYGLTLQTHPMVIGAAPALALYFVYAGIRPRPEDRPRALASWLKSPWPYAALAMALLGYGNVIVHNFFVQPGDALVRYEFQDSSKVTHLTLGTYLTGLRDWSILELLMASSHARGYGNPVRELAEPRNLLWLALLLVGGVTAVRRGKMLPVFLLGMATFLTPLYNRFVHFPEAARYGAFAQPILYVLVATPLARAIGPGVRSWGWRPFVSLALLLLIVVAPMHSLSRFYRHQFEHGSANELLLSIHDSVKRRVQSSPVYRVLLDEKLRLLRTGPGGRVFGVLECLLELDRIPHEGLPETVTSIGPYLHGGKGPAVLLISYRDSYKRLARKRSHRVLDARTWVVWPNGRIHVVEFRP